MNSIRLGSSVGCILLVLVIASCSQESAPTSKEQPAQKLGMVSSEAQDQQVAEQTSEPEPPAPVIPTISSELEKLCKNPEMLPSPFSGIRPEVREVVAQLYLQRQYQPWWFKGETFSKTPAEKAIEAFSMATAHALDPTDYFAEVLVQRFDTFESAAQVDVISESALTEMVLTLCVTALAYDLNQGRIPHQQVVTTWGGVEKAFEGESLLARLTRGDQAKRVFESYAPSHPKYQQLRSALAFYRKLQAQGGWTPIDATMLNGLKDKELEKGRHALVPLLRQRLTLEGYQVTPPDNPEADQVYDQALQQATRQFQTNRNLEPDGIVGPLTLKALNIPVEACLDKIIWSMDRCRWLPAELGKRHILVNVPEFTLRAYASEAEPVQMRVIVGDSQKGTFTPIFADEMEYVIFRPYWNIPRSIIEGELIPAIQEDPDYLEKYNFEIVERFGADAEVLKASRANLKRLEAGELKVRQTAGEYNSLGLVKFIFPNEYSVYLHDTNQRNLFVYSQRDLSHGCVRVQKPEVLARYALPENSWSDEKIHEAMYQGERQYVSLSSKIPVYIFYMTAFPTSGTGPMGFFHDLYGYDSKMKAYRQKMQQGQTVAGH